MEKALASTVTALFVLSVASAVGLAACADDTVAPGNDATSKPDTIIVGQDTVPDGGKDVVDTPDDGSVDALEDPGTTETEDDGSVEDADAIDAVPDNPKPPDIPDPDAPCVPDCEGKVCGDNGCGGICGYCAYPTVCNAGGQCVTVCEPKCDGKFCGGDGCGGTCGDCEEGLECGEDGLCYEPTCVPDCTGKVCGPDGCGGDCGLCVSPKVCVNGGCALGPCGTVDQNGQCEGNTLFWCEEKVNLQQQDCEEFEYVCTFDPFQNKYTCAEEPECVPNCANKQCGGDGCGGSCGACTNGWSCEQGLCQPEEGGGCGSFTAIGECIGDTLWWCNSNNMLSKLNCKQPPNTKCGWNVGDQKFDCL